eukprot:2128044-Ditylum_brightwellii.AAC.1
MAYVIHDGPSQYGDTEFTPLYHTQKLLQVAIAWIQHQSGWHTLILKDTLTHLPHVKSQWLPSLCNYLGQA